MVCKVFFSYSFSRDTLKKIPSCLYYVWGKKRHPEKLSKFLISHSCLLSRSDTEAQMSWHKLQKAPHHKGFSVYEEEGVKTDWAPARSIPCAATLKSYIELAMPCFSEYGPQGTHPPALLGSLLEHKHQSLSQTYWLSISWPRLGIGILFNKLPRDSH